MLPEAWKQLRRHNEQERMYRTKKRFVAAACGRGSGKTELARRRTVRFLAVKKPWPDPKYFYALPTFAQAKRVAWGPIKSLCPPDWIVKANDSEMCIETKFGSVLYVVGMDKPQRIEGTQWDGGVVDESCDQKPGHFSRSILPALSERRGWCWRIGVPKRFGPGAVSFKKFWDRGMHGDPSIDSFQWHSDTVLTAEEIDEVKALISQVDFDEQYGALWQDISGLIFHAFSKHNIKKIAYRADLPLIVGSDFNVNPMCWVIGHLVSNGLAVIDEVFLRNTNTQATLDYLFRKYGSHEAGFWFFGDATGAARRSSASTSDYILIRDDNRFKNKRVLYPQSNPLQIDRFAATNALLCNALEQRRCYIHPRCEHLISDLQSRAYKEGTRDPDDSGDVGHMTDALGYIIHMKFPLKVTPRGQQRVHMG